MSDYGWIGPYELIGELGRGAMARVWRAWDPTTHRQVAIKEPLFGGDLSGTSQAELGRRFASEARVASQLSHPGIVRVYDADVWDGRPAIVMELVEGKTLAQILVPGRLTPDQTLAVLDQLLDAVGYAHGCGVIHRDIKPDNVFVSYDGTVKLADFGIARMEGQYATVGTMLGTVLGTPGYLSPEQAVGNRVDGRSDLFSVGVIAYEMLTGANPFGAGDGSDATALLYRIVHEPVPVLPAWASAGLNVDLRPAIMCALAKDPAQRPQSAAEFKAMLHNRPAYQTVGTSASSKGTLRDLLEHGATAGAIPVVRTSPHTIDAAAEPIRTSDVAVTDEYGRGSAGNRQAWLPIAVVIGLASLALLGVLFSATSGVGGGGGGGSATQPTQTVVDQPSNTEQRPAETDTAAEPTDTNNSQNVSDETGQTPEQPTSSTATSVANFSRVEASSVLEANGSSSFGPEKVIDGDLTTAWGEGVSGYGTSTVGFGSGESIWLSADFEQVVHGIRIVGGYGLDEDVYQQYGRPQTVYVALSDGTLIEADLVDAYRQYQTIDFGGEYKTTFVYVSLGSSVYDGAVFDTTMISEIQVY